MAKLLPFLFLLGFAAAASPGHIKRQDGPVDPGINDKCTFWDTATDKNAGCQIFVDNWRISREDFIAWNPSVKPDCSGIIAGHSYCVEVRNDKPITSKPTNVPKETATSTSQKGPAESSSGPSPTQDGIISSCKNFYKAQPGDTCAGIVNNYGTFSLSDFLKWNPGVGSDCSSLLIDFYYCVGIPGTPSTKLPPSGPTPVQEGITTDCKRYYKVVDGDTCQKIVDKHRTFSLSDFFKWNPAVGSDCRSLFLDFYVCVGVSGTPDKPPSGPTPTQPGITKLCDKYYQAKSGDTCQGILNKYGTFQLTDFYRWNPAVKSDCSQLLIGTYYCVGVPAAFHVKSFYHADCTGKMGNDVSVLSGTDGLCMNTNCAAASIDTGGAGNCPSGQLQISYWEKPNCAGQWYGYGYTSRDTCRNLWSNGWKFQSVHLRCAEQRSDCVSQNTCKYDPEPAQPMC